MFNSKKLADYLKEKKISQAEFGALVGVSEPMINYLVKGFKQPSIALLKRIADALGCTADDLLVCAEDKV